MIKLAREYALPLIGFIVTLTLTLMSDFVLNLSKESTFLIFAIGSTVTLTITVLRAELIDSLDSRISRVLDLYNLYCEIKDPELRDTASDIIENARVELAFLSRGIINQPADLEFQDRILSKAHSTIKIVEAGNDSLSWKMGSLPSRESNWYTSLLEAVERGCQIELILVVDETKFDVSNLSFQDLGPMQDDRVEKHIVRRDEANKRGGTQLLYNFTIIDDGEVLYQRVVPGGGYDTLMDKSSTGVRQFKRKFETLRKIGVRVTPR